MGIRIVTAACLTMAALMSADAAEVDIQALFSRAELDGRVGTARKTLPVDARPAEPGAIVVSIIKGEGKETQSPPARAGDMVVRNRCEPDGNEEILVEAAKFKERYEGPLGDADAQGWRRYRPRGVEMRYFTLGAGEGPFSFVAPWGEPMTAKPGDAIVQDPGNPSDTYRIAAGAFACTYEVLEPAATSG